MMKQFSLVIFLLVAMTASDYTQAANTYETSYNCAKATTFTEKAVCNNKVLAALDIALANAYRETVSVNSLYDPTQKSILKNSQRDWLKSIQSDCPPNEGEKPQNISTQTQSCLATKYEKRIADLNYLRFESLKIKRVSSELNASLSKTCFHFDTALDTKQKLPLRSYIEMEPERDYSAAIQKGNLCITGLPYSSQTTVTLRKGLKSKSDKYITQDVQHKVNVSSRPSSLSLSSNSYILPKTGKPLLPIKTTNYPSVDLTFYRVDERNFISILPRSMFGQKIDHWDEDYIRDNYGAQVWAGSLDINNRENEEVVTQIPIKEMVDQFKPGIYILTARPPKPLQSSRNNFATQWVVVTDLGLSVFKGEKGLSLQTRSLKTAQALKNVQVKLVAKNNMILAEKKTSKDGWVEFSPALLNGKGGKEALYLTAQTKSGDFSFISLWEPALDLSEHGVAGQNPPGPLQTYLYSDRGIYRPGEKIKLGYLLRNDLSDAHTNLPLSIILYRPDGKEAFKTVATPDEIGGGRINIPLSKAAATGKWKLAAYSDPKASPIGTLNIQVEEFVPERLDVKAKLDTEKLKFGETAKLHVQADYFFGAPGSNLNMSGSARLQIDPAPFAQYGQFRFGLAEDNVNELKKLDQIKSDETGKGILEIPAFADIDLSSPLKIKVDVEVADTDGRPSRATLQAPLLKHEALVGMKPGFSGNALEYNQDALFEAISVNAEGTPIAGRTLNVEWIKEDRDYHWFYESGRWKSTYQKFDIPVHQETLTTDQDGKISFKRSFDRWGYFRCVVTDMQTGAASDYTFRVGWWANAQSPDTPDTLELSLEKQDVAPGDKIKGFIKAPFQGRALVTVAQKNVIWKMEIPLPKKGKEFIIPVKKEWGNGAYVLVTAYRPGTSEEQRGPGRAVGAQWVSFGKQQRTLDVEFELPDEVLPSTEIAVPVQVKGSVLGSEKVKLNIFAVDEGVLRLTRFKSPRPDAYLLAQQKLQLAYHDLYGRLIAPQKGERGNVRSGGDMANMGNQGGLSTRVFKTVALASQTLDIDKSGKGTAHFNIPDFNGKLRVFGVAYSQTATGGGESALIVRTPVITALLPSRFMAPGDKASFASRFLNLNGKKGEYRVHLETSDLLSVENPDWVVKSDVGQKVETRFHVTARKIGKAKLTLNVEGPDNFKQVRTWDIEVRPAQQWVTQTKQLELALSEKHTFEPDLFDQFLPGTGHLNLTLSARPEIDVQKLVTELDRYPYGCLEQTTSRAFPVLSFNKVKESWKDLKFDESSLDQKVTEGIIGILAKQRSDGSFGLWSRHSHAEPWLTAYAMDFLSEARKQGYDVLDGPFNAGIKWMKDVVKDTKYSADARAYMLLVLAKNDQFSTSNLKYEYNRLLQPETSSLGRAQIAAALTLKGIAPKALTAKTLTQRIRMEQHFFYTYGSPLRDFASILTLPQSIFASDQDRLSLLTSVLELAESKSYTSTQEKARLLQAAAKIAENSNDRIKVQIGDSEINREQTYRTLLTPNLLNAPYRIENKQDASLFVKYSLSGIPVKAMKEEANGLSITREILDMDGKTASLDKVKTGDKFIVLLSGKSTTNLQHKAMIADFLPAGFEIERNAFNEDLIKHLNLDPEALTKTEFKAERDDRFVAATTLHPVLENNSGDQNTFRLAYVVRAVTPGDYVYPAPFVEDMYKPSYFARGAQARLVVHSNE